MSIPSTVAASARPRKDSQPRPCLPPHSRPRQSRSYSTPRHASGSEEELALRQKRRNTAKTPCCVVSVLSSLTLHALIALVLVLALAAVLHVPFARDLT